MAKLHGTRVIRGTTDLDLIRVLSNEEVALVTPSVSGNPKFSFYQTSTERAYFLYNTGSNFEINSDTVIRIAPSNTASFDFSGLNLLPTGNLTGRIGSSTNKLLQIFSAALTTNTGTLTIENTGSSTGDIVQFRTNSTARFEVLNAGDFVPAVDNSLRIGSSSRRLQQIFVFNVTGQNGDLKVQALGGTSRYIQFDIDSNGSDLVRIMYPVSTNGSQLRMRNALATAYITGNTTDGSDSQSLIITPTDFNGVSGTLESRGASIELTGNEKTVALGTLYLKTGSSASSHLILQTNSTGGRVQLLLNAASAFEAGLNGTDKRFGPANGITDAYLVGPTGQAWQAASLISELVFNPGTNATATIRGSTSDASDNQRILITPANGSGATRGAYISLSGNEFSGTPGLLELFSGNVGSLNLGTTGSTPVGLYTNNTLRLSVSATGNLEYTNTTFAITANTSDGSDSSNIIIAGGGGGGGTPLDGTRGAYIRLNGNESINGRVDIGAGSNGGDLYLSTKSTGQVIFEAGGSARWRVRGSDGSLYKDPGASGIVLSNGGTIITETSDGSDNATIMIYSGGSTGASRSAGVRIYGNEAVGDGNAGGFFVGLGDTANARLILRHGSASSLIDIQDSASQSLLTISNSGSIAYAPTTFSINANTNDGSDNKQVQICGGGSGSSTRGSLIILSGNESSSAGDLYLIGGAASTSSILLDIESTGGQVAIRNTANQNIFRIVNGGTIEHKAHANFAGSGDFKWTRGLNTTDDVFQTITTTALADNTSYMVKVRIVGRLNSTTSKSIWGVLEFGVFRNNGGSATLIGTPARTWDDHGSPGYDFRANVSGNDVVIEVKGAAGETVSWAATIEMQGVSTSA